MNAYTNLVELSTKVLNGQLERSSMWQGANVIITSKPPIVRHDGFYPAPRYVVTLHASELSWLFEQLRNVFMEINDYGFFQEEIFGRLGNTANSLLSKNLNAEAPELLFAVMHEAFAIVEEIQDGEFAALMVSSGNQILDDLITESEKAGFLTIEETRAYFKNKGIIE